MKHYAWDYEETYYHIYGVSDFVDDEVFCFALPETEENDKRIASLVSSLNDISEDSRSYDATVGW